MGSVDRRQFLVGSAGAAVLLPLPAEPAALSKRALRELRAAVRGRVVVPRNSARIVYNRRFEGRRPDAVVHVESTADVAAAVRWADRFDVRLVARSGGHSYAGYSTHGRRRGARPVAPARRPRRARARDRRAGRPADRRAARAHPPRRERAGRLVPVRGHRRAGARRRPRPRRAALRAHERQPPRGAHRHRGRARADRGPEHERGPLLGMPRRRAAGTSASSRRSR